MSSKVPFSCFFKYRMMYYIEVTDLYVNKIRGGDEIFRGQNHTILEVKGLLALFISSAALLPLTPLMTLLQRGCTTFKMRRILTFFLGFGSGCNLLFLVSGKLPQYSSFSLHRTSMLSLEVLSTLIYHIPNRLSIQS